MGAGSRQARLAWCVTPLRNATLVLVFILAGPRVGTGHPAVQLPPGVRDALDARNGAALVLALPGKSVLARYGSPAALDEPHATGSAIKPLTALIALESGALPARTEILCRREVRSGGLTFRCAHPTVLLPFGVTEALALSCNYYFAEVGRRLGREALERGFRQAGLEAEITDPALGAIGGAGVRATPRQLLDLLIALAAGHLPFRPENMELVRRGLEAAVREGTASPAAVEGVLVAGKTGTAAWPHISYRNSGWFAGWAPAGRPQVAVVIWLHRGEGRDAAAIAGEILRQHFAPARPGPSNSASHPAAAPAFRVELFSSVPITHLTVEPPDGAPSISRDAASAKSETLRVDCPGEGCRVTVNKEMTPAGSVALRRVQGALEIRSRPGRLTVIHAVGLEEYVAGVLAGEAGEIRHPESLKAMAVAARTFALRSRGRHAAAGFDFCSLTHCQVYTSQAPEESFRAAAVATAGEALRYGGELIRAYYTGSCGGYTQAAANVWPEEAAAYLPARPDPYCASSGANSALNSASNWAWTTRLPSAQLEAALRGDRVADPGGRIIRLEVTARDSSGRVRQLLITGGSARKVNGNYFRFLVGRRLGWEKLKSTAFEVRREGGDFVFGGRGFGHGVGLCQAGAARMGEAGFSYDRILAQYFPGAQISRDGREIAGAGSVNPQSAIHNPQSEALASEHFSLRFPAGRGAEAEAVAAALEAARSRFSARGLPAPAGRVSVALYESTAAFIQATGKAGWVAATADGRRLHLQPPAVLRARGTLDFTLAHEYLHLALWNATDARIPLWFREGVVLYFSGEQPSAAAGQTNAADSGVTLEQALERPPSRDLMRRAYARALEETRALARQAGEAGLLRMLRQPTAAEMERMAAIARRPL